LIHCEEVQYEITYLFTYYYFLIIEYRMKQCVLICTLNKY